MGLLWIFRELVILKNDWVKVFGVKVISLLMLDMLKCFICLLEMVDVEWGVFRIDLLKLKIVLMFWLGKLFSEFFILIFLILVLDGFFCVKVVVDSIRLLVMVSVIGVILNLVVFMVFFMFLEFL